MNSQDIANKSQALVTALANQASAETTVKNLMQQLEVAQGALDNADKAVANAQADLNAAINPPTPPPTTAPPKEEPPPTS